MVTLRYHRGSMWVTNLNFFNIYMYMQVVAIIKIRSGDFRNDSSRKKICYNMNFDDKFIYIFVFSRQHVVLIINFSLISKTIIIIIIKPSYTNLKKNIWRKFYFFKFLVEFIFYSIPFGKKKHCECADYINNKMIRSETGTKCLLRKVFLSISIYFQTHLKVNKKCKLC